MSIIYNYEYSSIPVNLNEEWSEGAKFFFHKKLPNIKKAIKQAQGKKDLAMRIQYVQAAEACLSKELKAVISERFPLLTVCPCLNVKERSFLQYQALEKIQEIDSDRAENITIVSVGCGRCLEEAETLFRLQAIGYRNITLILIDPCIERNGALLQLKEFISNMQIPVHVISYTHSDAYMVAAKENQTLRPDLLLLIDVENDSNEDVSKQILEDFYKQNVLQPDRTVIASGSRRAPLCVGLFKRQLYPLASQIIRDWELVR